MQKSKSLIILTLFFLVFSCTNYLFSQVLFSDENSNYALIIDSGLNISNKKSDNIDMDVFSSNFENNNYTLIISKIKNSTFINGNVIDDLYKEKYLDDCDCDIVSEEVTNYNNVHALNFELTFIKNKTLFKGRCLSFVANNILYQVLFITLSGEFDMTKNKLGEVMNTFIVNGLPTVNSYKEYKNMDKD